jgi:rod shape determining protein RodA
MFPPPSPASPGVLLPLAMLVVFGGFVLYSAAGGHLQPWALTHVLRFCVFLALAMLIARVPQDWFKRAALPIYAGLCVLLVLVELIGGIGGGSQRWLNLGFMTLQPSELMKPGIVLVLAWFYSVLPVGETRGWRAVAPAAVLLGIPAGLVMLQPTLAPGWPSALARSSPCSLPACRCACSWAASAPG